MQNAQTNCQTIKIFCNIAYYLSVLHNYFDIISTKLFSILYLVKLDTSRKLFFPYTFIDNSFGLYLGAPINPIVYLSALRRLKRERSRSGKYAVRENTRVDSRQ